MIFKKLTVQGMDAFHEFTVRHQSHSYWPSDVTKHFETVSWKNFLQTSLDFLMTTIPQVNTTIRRHEILNSPLASSLTWKLECLFSNMSIWFHEFNIPEFKVCSNLNIYGDDFDPMHVGCSVQEVFTRQRELPVTSRNYLSFFNLFIGRKLVYTPLPFLYLKLLRMV